MSWFLMVLLFSFGSAIVSAKDWDAEYHRLNLPVEQGYSEPRGDPPQLEPYLLWLTSKFIAALPLAIKGRMRFSSCES